MRSNKIKKPVSEKVLSVSFHTVLIFFSFVCVASFLLILAISFQSQSEITNSGYSLFPKQTTIEAYKLILERPMSLVRSYGITLLSTVLGSALGVWLSATAGYVISRKDYRYNRIVSFYIFFTMLFNGGLVPNYIMFANWFHLKNTVWVLILPLLISAWNIILFKGFFQGIPDALVESAKLDGAGEFRIFIQIVLPISKPAIATITLFYVLGYWNDWYNSLLYTTDGKYYTLQYLLMLILKNVEFLNSATARAMSNTQDIVVPTLNVRMAMCVLAAGPILVIFPFFQKYFVKGITIGAVKG